MSVPTRPTYGTLRRINVSRVAERIPRSGRMEPEHPVDAKRVGRHAGHVVSPRGPHIMPRRPGATRPAMFGLRGSSKLLCAVCWSGLGAVSVCHLFIYLFIYFFHYKTEWINLPWWQTSHCRNLMGTLQSSSSSSSPVHPNQNCSPFAIFLLFFLGKWAGRGGGERTQKSSSSSSSTSIRRRFLSSPLSLSPRSLEERDEEEKIIRENDWWRWCLRRRRWWWWWRWRMMRINYSGKVRQKEGQDCQRQQKRVVITFFFFTKKACLNCLKKVGWEEPFSLWLCC